MTMRPQFFPRLLLLGTIALLLGCQTIQYPKGLLEQQKGKAGMTSRELRVILDDLVVQYCGRVEQSADRIIAANPDPRIRKNALLWKTNGIAACFQAGSRRDPLGAFLDIWTLNKQSIDLFERPSDERLFGASQWVAIETSQQLDQSMRQILDMIGTDFPIREEFPEQFSHDYPIENLYFNRESIAAHYTRYMAKIKVANRELMDVVGDLDDQLDQLHKISSLYAEFLPKQARWQGEIMVLETLQAKTITESLANLSVATDGVARIADTTEVIPELVQRERDYLHRAIQEERMATLSSIDQMRAETMGEIRAERLAVMSGLQQERDAVLHAVHNERIAATQDLTDFGKQTVVQIDASVDAKIEQISAHSTDLADHIFQRVAQLCGVFAAVILVGIMLFRSRKSKPSPEVRSSDTVKGPTLRTPTYLDEHRRKAA